MRCSNCGMELDASSQTCSHCGTAVSQNFNYHNMENELLNTVLEDENMTAYPPDGSPDMPDNEQEPEVKKQWGKLGAALLTSVAVFAGAMFGLQSFSDEYSYEETETGYQECLLQIVEEDYEKALASVERLLEKDETNLEYLSLKNTICMETGNKKAQIKVLRKIIAQDPDNYPAYEQLLELYLEGQKQDAITKLAANPPNSIISSMIKACMVDAPYLELPPGVYDSNQLLELTSEQGHNIYYTLDGSSPQENGKLYSEPIPLEQGYLYLVTAVCKNKNGTYGEESNGEYRIGINAEMVSPFATLEPPEVVPAEGAYTTAQLITVSVPIGNRAYYSWTAGEELTPENGTLYTGGIAMPQGDSMLSVIQVDDKGNSSDVKQVHYTYEGGA